MISMRLFVCSGHVAVFCHVFKYCNSSHAVGMMKEIHGCDCVLVYTCACLRLFTAAV